MVEGEKAKKADWFAKAILPLFAKFFSQDGKKKRGTVATRRV